MLLTFPPMRTDLYSSGYRYTRPCFFLRFIVMQEGIPLHLYKCIIGRKRGVAGILAESVTYYIKKLGCRGGGDVLSVQVLSLRLDLFYLKWTYHFSSFFNSQGRSEFYIASGYLNSMSGILSLSKLPPSSKSTLFVLYIPSPY